MMNPNRPLHELKILVTSTPKTGNNWIKQLLAAAYHLPMGKLQEPFVAGQLDGLGDRWIGHQHYYPTQELLDWIAARNVVVVTTARHPGDVLVSLYYHIRNRQHGPGDRVGRATTMESDRRGPGKYTAKYVRQEFFLVLDVSIAWMRSGSSLIVRYEDMWRDPVGTLTELTSQIAPLSQDRIVRAVAQCQIGKLRGMYDPKGRFFRKGTIGNWVQELPDEIKELFRRYEPYPTQFATLGYTMDPSDPLISAPAQEFVFQNPFDNLTHFENGVPIPPVVEKLYLSLDADFVKRWDSVECTSAPDSFFDWLNAPAMDDPLRDTGIPVITNLAVYIHSMHKNLQLKYPDIYHQNRIGYANWFSIAGQNFYALDDAYVPPGLSPLLEPSAAPAQDHKQDSTAPAARSKVAKQSYPTSLNQVLKITRVEPHLPIAWPSWPKGLWPKIVALAQKVSRRLLRWYINPIIEQQNAFNAAAAQTLEEMGHEIARLQKDVKALQPSSSETPSLERDPQQADTPVRQNQISQTDAVPGKHHE
jgi:hypothetical protein